MSDVIAHTASRNNIVDLKKFVPTPIVSLNLNRVAGEYLVFGKVAFLNYDTDAQDAHIRLRQSDGAAQASPIVLDETFVRLDGGDGYRTAASVQAGVVISDGKTFIEIACDTYRGGALNAQLAAVNLNTLDAQ